MTQYNGTTLAYIGDAIYEVIIREHLLNKGFSKVENLHNEAIKYTSAVGQAKALNNILDVLSAEEVAVFKRGRNANTERKARNATLAEYKQSTGFEALIGYLYLNKSTDRIDQLIAIITK